MEYTCLQVYITWSTKTYIGFYNPQQCEFINQLVGAAFLSWFLSFCSGVIGSGLAIFSKHRIQDALLYRYSLNGYPYMVSHCR